MSIPSIGNTVMLVADNVQTVVVPGGHWLVEQAPKQLLAALTTFLAPTATQRSRLAR